ncbi:MAG: hypothetical protein HZB25_02940 [Candidatus Eisenbacteria bacterium]|nr:hypothetical protein [Candidatus Eisenbacteria bacterium]
MTPPRPGPIVEPAIPRSTEFPAWARWALRAVLLVVPAALAVACLRPMLSAQGRLGFPMDDPYIHFQYARNLAHGAGFSFNPGEPSPGATSPLWVVLLAAGNAMGAPLEPWAVVLGILASCAAALLTMEVGRAAGLSTPLAFLAGLATATSGRMTWGALSGMEVCVAMALALAAVRMHLSGAHGWKRALGVGALAGLAGQARPEAALLGVLLCALEAWRAGRGRGPSGAPGVAVTGRRGSGSPPAVRRSGSRIAAALRATLPCAAAMIAVMLPYGIFCLATTGRPFPNTFYAKSLIPLGEGIAWWNGGRAHYLQEAMLWAFRDNSLLVLLAPGLLLWGFRSRWAGRGAAMRPLALPLWPLVFWAYALVFFPMHFSLSRYTIPLVPFTALVAMVCLEALQAALGSATARRGVELVAALILVVGATRSQFMGQETYRLNVDNILHMQVAMGEWVAQNVPPGSKIANNDVGAITYIGGRYCIDVMGLVSSDFVTELLERRRAGLSPYPDDALPGYLDERGPDYCILFPEWFPDYVRSGRLVPIHEIDYENTTGGGNQLVVYRFLKRAR